MPKIVDLKQGSPEWKEWRKWKIGASMAAAIMGVSPWQTPLQLWESIVMDDDSAPNFAMQRGTRLEEQARDLLNKEKLQEWAVKYRPECFEHKDIPWMIASMDGVISTHVFKAGHAMVHAAVEIKCPGREAHQMALNGIVPPYYMPQLQHQMVVCDLTKILYYSFDGENGIGIEVYRDDEYITKKLLPAEAAFYQSLIDFKPPEACDQDLIVIDDPKAIEHAKLYVKAMETVKNNQKVADECKELLIRYAQDRKCKIGNLVVQKIIRKGSIDYSKVAELKDVKLDKYRKEPVISWRVS
ncbi:MAG: YqaJ viral recombinase family protein [Patescibacteria group bacterium]